MMNIEASDTFTPMTLENSFHSTKASFFYSKELTSNDVFTKHFNFHSVSF